MLNLVIENAPIYSIEILSNELKKEMEREGLEHFKIKFFEMCGDLIVRVYILGKYLLKNRKELANVHINIVHRRRTYQKNIALDSFTIDALDNRVLSFNCRYCSFENNEVLGSTNLIIANVESEDYLIEKQSVDERILKDAFTLYNFNLVDCKKYLYFNYSQKYLNFFNALNTVKSKTDFFVFCFLHKEGGVYVSTKLIGYDKFIKIPKENGVVFLHSEYSSFIFAKFEKGFVYLKYVIDKLLESNESVTETSLCLKYQKDYNDFIEKQINIMSTVHSYEFEYLDNNYLYDCNYNVFSDEQFIKKLAYQDGKFLIYEDSSDKICNMCILKIKNPNYYLVYINNCDKESGPVNIVLTVVNGMTVVKESFKIENSHHIWFKNDDKDLDTPDLQHVIIDNWDVLCKRLAIYYHEKKMLEISNKFFKEINKGDNKMMIYGNDDLCSMFISSCGDEPKNKHLAYYANSRLFILRNGTDVDLGMRLLRFSREERMFDKCEYYYNQVYKIIKSRMNVSDRNELDELNKKLAEIYTEYMIFAHYLGYSDVYDKLVFLLNYCVHHYKREGCIFNYRFYRKPLISKSVINISEKLIKCDGVQFHSSSSTFVKEKDCFILNKRFVNYIITPDGGYEIPPRIENEKEILHNKYITVNKYIKFTHDWKVIEEKVFETEIKNIYIMQTPCICEGIEDLRLFKYKDELYYMGIICLKSQYNMSINKYDVKKNHIEMKPSKSSENFQLRDCEKNWCFIQNYGKPYFVYKWRPLTICEIDFADNKITQVMTKETPAMFDFARGSTNLIPWKDNEYIGLVHIVDYNNHKKRFYYHVFVVLDENLELKVYSNLYTFLNSDIEYCLAIGCDDESVFMSVSTEDSNSYIITYDKSYISDLLVN